MLSQDLTPLFSSFKLQEEPKETDVNVMVTWVDLTSKNDSYLWDSLLIAIENFVDQKYMQCILPENICIEAKMRLVIENYFKKFYGENYYKEYCKSDHNFGYHQCLNHLLPIIVKEASIPALNASLHKILNDLKELRNKVGHRGKAKKELSKSETANYLSAVIISFNYLSYIERKLDLLG